MNLQDFLNSRRGGEVGLRISRWLPPRLGNSIARFAADRIAARRDLALVRAIRANQWVVGGCKDSPRSLDQNVKESLRHTAISFYTFFHYLENPEALQELIVFSPQAEYLIECSQEAKRGVLVSGVHMSNFDLVAIAAAYRGLRAVGLSLPNPNETVEWQHNLRRVRGLEILPASISGIRETISRLQEGQVVMTGIDRPVDDPKYRPLFFGRPANVPVHYVHMALKARAPLVIMAAILRDDGKYHILSSDFIELQPHQDRHVEIVKNAEMVLEIAAEFIRQAPQQWSNSRPVWPEALTEMP